METLVRFFRFLSTTIRPNRFFRGCVTPAILDALANATTDGISGFNELRYALERLPLNHPDTLSFSPSDQQKVRLAISLRRVDPSDVPATAKVRIAVPAAASSRTTLKRKADSASLVPPPPAQGTRRAIIAEEEEVATAPLEEVRDEMYAFMNTDVVGIRHYRGGMFYSCPSSDPFTC